MPGDWVTPAGALADGVAFSGLRSQSRFFARTGPGFRYDDSGGTTTMPRPIEVRPLSPYRLWLRYDDGVEGEVDLSHLAGRGVFEAWGDPSLFKSVRLGPQEELVWGDRIDLCLDAVHMRLTGKRPDEVVPGAHLSGVREADRITTG